MDDTTYVFDAEGLILGRLASKVADLLLKSARAGGQDKVIIVNSEKAIVSMINSLPISCSAIGLPCKNFSNFSISFFE